MTPPRLRRARIAACAVILSLAASLPAFAQTTLPAAVAADVNESYRLLARTYYKPVDQQSLIDAGVPIDSSITSRPVQPTVVGGGCHSNMHE